MKGEDVLDKSQQRMWKVVGTFCKLHRMFEDVFNGEAFKEPNTFIWNG